MKLKYHIVTREIIRDQDTKGISAINIYDRIRLERFPHIIRQLVSISTWSKEPDDENSIPISLIVYDGEREMMTTNQTVDFEGSPSCVIVTKIRGIPVSEPTTLSIVINQSENRYEYLIPVSGKSKIEPSVETTSTGDTDA